MGKPKENPSRTVFGRSSKWWLWQLAMSDYINYQKVNDQWWLVSSRPPLFGCFTWFMSLFRFEDISMFG